MVYDGPHGEAKMALYIAQTVVGDGFFVRSSTRPLGAHSTFTGVSAVPSIWATLGGLDRAGVLHPGLRR